MNDNRYILVIADDSNEMEIALEYACARSKKTSRKIIIAAFIEPLDVLTTQGVSEIMKNEARNNQFKKTELTVRSENEIRDENYILEKLGYSSSKIHESI